MTGAEVAPEVVPHPASLALAVTESYRQALFPPYHPGKIPAERQAAFRAAIARSFAALPERPDGLYLPAPTLSEAAQAAAKLSIQRFMPGASLAGLAHVANEDILPLVGSADSVLGSRTEAQRARRLVELGHIRGHTLRAFAQKGMGSLGIDTLWALATMSYGWNIDELASEAAGNLHNWATYRHTLGRLERNVFGTPIGQAVCTAMLYGKLLHADNILLLARRLKPAIMSKLRVPT